MGTQLDYPTAYPTASHNQLPPAYSPISQTGIQSLQPSKSNDFRNNELLTENFIGPNPITPAMPSPNAIINPSLNSFSNSRVVPNQ